MTKHCDIYSWSTHYYQLHGNKFLQDSEAFASEFLENLEKIYTTYHECSNIYTSGLIIQPHTLCYTSPKVNVIMTAE